jgi:fatty acid desaturase
LLAGTVGLSAAKIVENMEIGHNVMHGQVGQPVAALHDR